MWAPLQGTCRIWPLGKRAVCRVTPSYPQAWRPRAPRCERQDRQLDFDFQLCEASGCGARGGGSLIAPAVPSVGNGGARETLAIQSSQQLNPLPRRFWQGRKAFPLLLPGRWEKVLELGMGRMLRQVEETHGSGHALTGGTEAAAGDFDPERWWGAGRRGSRGQARCEEGGGPVGGGVCWPGPSSL